jgi:hypothetical protein
MRALAQSWAVAARQRQVNKGKRRRRFMAGWCWGFRWSDARGQGMVTGRRSFHPLPIVDRHAIDSGHEVSPLRQDRAPDPRLLVWWHALPIQMDGRGAGGDSGGEPGQSRSVHPSRRRSWDQPHRDGPPLRDFGDAVGSGIGPVPARETNRPDEGASGREASRFPP